MKKFIKLLAVITVLSCMCLQISAAVIEPVSPQWSNINSVSVSLNFSGTTGTIICTVYGSSDVTEIFGTLVLWEDNVEIGRWDMSSSNTYSIASDTFTGKSGSSYILMLNARVKADGIWETVTGRDSATCP